MDAEPVEPPAAFLEALEDDLNTPRAMAEMFAMAKALETAESGGARRQAKAELVAAAELMGVLALDPDAWFEAGIADDDRVKIDALVAARTTARADKDWGEADRLRDELNALNVEVMDGPTGATWRFKS